MIAKIINIINIILNLKLVDLKFYYLINEISYIFYSYMFFLSLFRCMSVLFFS